MDGIDELCHFADVLEEACLDVLGKGIMTKDLVLLSDPSVQVREVLTEEFLSEIRQEIEKKLS